MWALYDELIGGIPDDLTADQIICGVRNSLVKSGGNYGFTSTWDAAWRPRLLPKKAPGMPLKALAACVKSWDFAEASLGLAAINAYYNDIETLKSLGVSISPANHTEDRAFDPFIAYQNEIKGKNVVVIGRFPYLDKLFAPVCRLSVIVDAKMKLNERIQLEDAPYPEQSAEYLLPESDYVFISCYALAEKSLPRFLNLAQNARVILVGKAAPLSPVLHRYGVYDLAGFVVKDGEGAADCCLGLGGNLYAFGQKVSFKAPHPD